jgi:hypothetical protein
MPVIRRGDDQSVEVLPLLIEHLPEVLVNFGLGIEIEDRRGVLGVEVAECDDVFAPAAGHVILAHAANAHGGEPELVAGHLVANTSQDMARHHQQRQASGNCCAPGQFALAWLVRIHEQVLLCRLRSTRKAILDFRVLFSLYPASVSVK